MSAEKQIATGQNATEATPDTKIKSLDRNAFKKISDAIGSVGSVFCNFFVKLENCEVTARNIEEFIGRFDEKLQGMKVSNLHPSKSYDIANIYLENFNLLVRDMASSTRQINNNDLKKDFSNLVGGYDAKESIIDRLQTRYYCTHEMSERIYKALKTDVQRAFESAYNDTVSKPQEYMKFQRADLGNQMRGF